MLPQFLCMILEALFEQIKVDLTKKKRKERKQKKRGKRRDKKKADALGDEHLWHQILHEPLEGLALEFLAQGNARANVAVRKTARAVSYDMARMFMAGTVKPPHLPSPRATYSS